MNKFVTLILAVAAAISGTAFAQNAPLSTDIKAAVPNSAYVQDARGIVARDPYGLCWRAGYYTPADAIQGCDLPLCTDKEKLEGGKCVPIDPTCVAPQVLDPVKHVCYTPKPVCTPPAFEKDGVCVTPPPAPVAPKPTATKVSFAADALFDFDKAVLKKEGKAKMDDMASKLSAINLEVIIAVGHTDSVGADTYNQKLSVKRAEAVKAYLMSKGIEANRIYTEGKGEKAPVADNKTAAGRAANRRVEIEVVGTSKQ
jgi:OOP family OmpA-OmpF porin